MEKFDFIVIGGGAAGFFGAIACAEAKPGARVLLLEATTRVLTKVKISGGGRCNVTHHQFEPKLLINNYPRGQKELLGAFHRFQARDTVQWFQAHGVELKIEDDGRMFPVSNNSQTIIDCLEGAAKNSGVKLRTKSLVQKITRDDNGFLVQTRDEQEFSAPYLLLATGSMPEAQALARSLGHRLIDPVPSLFTFQISHPLIEGLAGLSFPKVRMRLRCPGSPGEFNQEGPCLITHWGLSGPAVLKLSAFAARELHSAQYQAELQINWEPQLTQASALQKLEQLKLDASKKKLSNESAMSCPRRFWEAILKLAEVKESQIYAETSRKQLQSIADLMCNSSLQIMGKGVFKEEFVTAGGICRDEIDFRSMASKICKGLYLAGEVLDVDGITGGFNFQNAWTGGWLAGQAVAAQLSGE